ncbi:sugar phosphate isomerase/epimerase [Streptacidiphilus pinicola]|uniref:Sugar phosphate isomerase/epimerase n=1 Tax=Streptacidiphilus pinicola TaxID=2219663 RepID=A0A2X0IDS0_9ACTN|nr:sugar phosphate isomerase/epimerase family protein [Streptacidiphilus pinicola]RAG83142.1 sugar phosphate isomerase/epimerase [Streptacidiphilus pinicola]
MRLAFSTLGLPGYPLSEALRLADRHGWEGLELRCAPGESIHPTLDPDQRRSFARDLEHAGIVPLCLAGYVGVAEPGDDAAVVGRLREELQLAADLGAAHLRVFPRGGDTPAPEVDARAARRLTAAAETAERVGVRLVVETHDSHRGGAEVARLLALVDHPAVGAIWDLLHTCLAGETPHQTRTALGSRLAYTQVKDVASHHDLTPLPLGTGVLPIADCVGELDTDAWVSWEYEAPWYPQAAPLPGLLGPGSEYLRPLR